MTHGSGPATTRTLSISGVAAVWRTTADGWRPRAHWRGGWRRRGRCATSAVAGAREALPCVQCGEQLAPGDGTPVFRERGRAFVCQDCAVALDFLRGPGAPE